MKTVMEYLVLSPTAEETVRKIRAEIAALQNWGYDESVKRLRITHSAYNGANFTDLKRLAQAYRPDESVATALWYTRRREEQLVACLLFPPDMERSKIKRLLAACGGYEAAEYAGALHLSRRPDIAEVVEELDGSDNPFHRIALLTAVARHFITHGEKPLLAPETFRALANRTYEDKYVALVAARYRSSTPL